jgi:hypothetical protein
MTSPLNHRQCLVQNVSCLKLNVSFPFSQLDQFQAFFSSAKWQKPRKVLKLGSAAIKYQHFSALAFFGSALKT